MGQSFDIMAANERIRAAQADVRAAQPWASQIGGTTTAGRERTGGDGIAAGTANTAALSASFVFDLFGGARRAREGAAAALQSACLLLLCGTEASGVCSCSQQVMRSAVR